MTLACNSALFGSLTDAYPFTQYAGFVLSVGALQWLCTCLLIALGTWLLPLRPVLSALLLLAGACAVFDRAYGSVVDITMIQNVVETDLAEVAELVTLRFAIEFLLLGVLPALLVWGPPVRRTSIMERTRTAGAAALLAVIGCVVLILPFSAEYASFFRAHKSVRLHSNPIYPVYSLGVYAHDQLIGGSSSELAVSLADARIPEHPGRELIVMVVGETARWDRFGINGYGRNTTPRLMAEPRLTTYANVSSCGTTTAISVPCMFSFTTSRAFDQHDILTRENVLDVLQRAGVNVLWRDNNSGSKGVAARVAFEDFSNEDRNPVCDPECRDIGMLDELDAYVDAHGGDILIILHQKGSHGPAYHQRYPAAFERFTPACRSAELSACTAEAVNNAYDNTILYTDFFLSQVIDFLKRHDAEFETAMLYVSDHGESLGEHGVYLHGLPRLLAPASQTHVPLLLWTGQHSSILKHTVDARSQQAFSHDAISPSLLLAFEVEETQLDDASALFSVEEHDEAAPPKG